LMLAIPHLCSCWALLRIVGIHLLSPSFTNNNLGVWLSFLLLLFFLSLFFSPGNQILGFAHAG
jgi:hypothetical protein